MNDAAAQTTALAEGDLPFIVLQSLLGSDGRYGLIRIAGAGANDPGSVGRLLGALGLAAVAGSLPILLPAATVAALGSDTGATLQIDQGETSPPLPTTAMNSGPAATLMLKLVGQVASDADTQDIEATLKQDPQLSVQLLRLVNSAAFSPSAHITSFKQAITMLGRRQLQRWLQLLLFARSQAKDQANPLLPMAAARAALMEALCAAGGGSREARDEAYMVGMFSLLEQLFGKPLPEVLGTLQLAPAISAALLQHVGPHGLLLKLVESVDRDPEVTAAALADTGVSHAAWCEAQIGALRWALQISKDC